jgi:hypothetical protein
MASANTAHILKNSSVSIEVSQYQSADVANEISALSSRITSEIGAVEYAWLTLLMEACESKQGIAAGLALRSHCNDLTNAIRPFIGDRRHYKTWFYGWLAIKLLFNVLAFVTAIVGATFGIEVAAAPRNVAGVVKNIIILIHEVSLPTLSSSQHLEGFVERYVTAIPPLLTYAMSLFLHEWHGTSSYIIVNLVLGMTLASASIALKVLRQVRLARVVSACKAFGAGRATEPNETPADLSNIVRGLDEISARVQNIICARKSGRATQEQVGRLLRAVTALRDILSSIAGVETHRLPSGEGRHKCVVWILALLVVAFQAVASRDNGYQVGEAVRWGVFALFLLGEAAFDLLESLDRTVNIFCWLISGAFFALFFFD